MTTPPVKGTPGKPPNTGMKQRGIALVLASSLRGDE